MVKRLQIYFVSLFCLLILAVNAAAQTVPLWGRWEQTFTASTLAAPETQFTIELTSPSGKVFTVAGFWDGGVDMACAFYARRGRHVALPYPFRSSSGWLGWKDAVHSSAGKEQEIPLSPAWPGAHLSQWSFFRTCRWNALLLDGRHSLVWCDLEFRS